jgi:hypothetical protein
MVQATKVVGAQGSSIADLDLSTHTSSTAGLDNEARNAINAILNRLRASTGHGLIA